MFTLEPREAGVLRQILTPIWAILATMIAGAILFLLLGKNPISAIRVIFLDPLFDPFALSEMLVKAAPLALIAIGLSFGFRAGIWNIGAEGQFILGAICGGAVGLAFYPNGDWYVLPLMLLAGIAGGIAWAMIPAILRVRFGANEILVSLMLVYVAVLLLSALVSGPLRDPDGFNFPESRQFQAGATLPILVPTTRIHLGIAATILLAPIAWMLLARHIFGYRVKLTGAAPRAALFAGISPNGMIIACLALSGGLAGLAGIFEAAGPVGQLVPALPTGYGFTAIIVAFLGRLHPMGILAASLVLALTIIGGETAQFSLQIPAAAISVFQGMLLFFLLGFDTLTRYRIRRILPGAAE